MMKKTSVTGLYERNGYYYIRINLCGKDHRESIGQKNTANKEKAKARLRELKNQAHLYNVQGQASQILRDLERATERRTIDELAEEFLAEKVNSKPSALSQYTSIINYHILPEFKGKDIKHITESMVARWQAKLATKETNGKALSAVRINTIVQQLRTMMTIAARRKYIIEDPTKNIKRLQEKAPDIDPLSMEELQLALDAVDSHFKPLFTCLAYTGARPNELEALRWSDIDWHRKEFSITKGRVRGIEGLPKSRSANRVLPMLGPVTAALQELKKRPVQHTDGFIFLDKKGEPIKTHLDRVWERALRKSGLRHRPSYQLRHTFASMLLMEGFAPGYVAKLLGHSGLEMLYRHYGRWIQDATKKQEEALRKRFDSELVTQVVTPDETVKTLQAKTLTPAGV